MLQGRHHDPHFGALALCLAALHAELHVVKDLSSAVLSWNLPCGAGDSECNVPCCAAVPSPVNNPMVLHETPHTGAAARENP